VRQGALLRRRNGTVPELRATCRKCLSLRVFCLTNKIYSNTLFCLTRKNCDPMFKMIDLHCVMSFQHVCVCVFTYLIVSSKLVCLSLRQTPWSGDTAAILDPTTTLLFVYWRTWDTKTSLCYKFVFNCVIVSRITIISRYLSYDLAYIKPIACTPLEFVNPLLTYICFCLWA
jgi:hypothetical protein